LQHSGIPLVPGVSGLVGLRADWGRYILGLLFMSVIFSNGLLAYVWWSPDISAAGRWIMIFVPFFNVIPLYLDPPTISMTSY
jgi:hypothetical protein